MTVGWISSTATQSGSASANIVGNGPATVAAGDLLVAHLVTRANSTISTVPGGWTLIRSDTSGTSMSNHTYWYPGTSGDSGGSWTWVASASVSSTVHLTRLSGADTTTPINGHNGTSSSGNVAAVTVTGFTTTLDNCYLMLMAGENGNVAFNTTSGMTEEYDTGTGTGGTSRHGMMDDEQRPTQGATGNRDATLASGTLALAAALVAIAPAATPASLIIPTETVQRILSRR